MAISNAFKGAYTNEVSQKNQTINTISSGVKDLALLGLGIANVASGGALAGKMTQFVGKSLGGGAVMNLLNQKQASANNKQETKTALSDEEKEAKRLENSKKLSKKELGQYLGDNPINRNAVKKLMTVYDKLVQAKEEGTVKGGNIETSMGKVPIGSELGQKILMGGK